MLHQGARGAGVRAGEVVREVRLGDVAVSNERNAAPHGVRVVSATGQAAWGCDEKGLRELWRRIERNIRCGADGVPSVGAGVVDQGAVAAMKFDEGDVGAGAFGGGVL